MALLTLAQLISDVQASIPNKEQDPIVRAANKVVRRIYTEMVEPVEDTFTTVPAVTTGTVSVTQDSMAVTFSSGIVLVGDPLRFVKIGGDNTWFSLARGAGDTLGTLGSKWASPTDAAAAHTIVYPTVTFPVGVGEIMSIQQSGYEPLKFHAGASSRDVNWWPVDTGIPTHWGPYVHDESTADPLNDRLRIILRPFVQDRRVYGYKYKPRVQFMDPAGATTQTVPLQDRWYESIVEGVLFHVWDQEARYERAAAQEGRFERALARARGAAIPAAVIPPRRRWRPGYIVDSRPIG